MRRTPGIDIAAPMNCTVTRLKGFRMCGSIQLVQKSLVLYHMEQYLDTAGPCALI